MFTPIHSESEFNFKKTLDPNLDFWIMDNQGGSSGLNLGDTNAGFSFESFPQVVTHAGFDDGFYTGQANRTADSFGFPTELEIPSSLIDIPRRQGSDISLERNISSKPPSSSQLKNRKAQKKFREKQKAKMINLSEEVEALRRQVERLSVKNRDLENSNQLLNKVIKMRDRQMNILRIKTEALTDKEPAAKLPELLTNTDGEALSMERSITVASHLTQNFPTSKFADINHAKMKDIWKHYVDELSKMLINLEADPDNKALEEKVRMTVAELGEICMNCATLSPISMCHLVANGDSVTPPPADSVEVQEFWQNVVRSLKLTAHQENLLLELRSRFLDHLEVTWTKRTELHGKLQVRCLKRSACLREGQMLVDSKEDVFKSNLNSCRSGGAVRQIFEELRDTCLTDGQYHTDFIASFFQLVLGDLQTARVFVESYPYYPDVLQISNLVFKSRGGSESIESSESKMKHSGTDFSAMDQ